MNHRFIGVDGEKLRTFRRARALSQRDLSRVTGVAFDTISRLETGKQHRRRLVANLFGRKPGTGFRIARFKQDAEQIS